MELFGSAPVPPRWVSESAVAASQLLLLRVRVVRAGGVAVHDPLDPAVDDGGVGVAVDGQVRRDLLHALARVAVVEDLRLVVDAVGEQQVRGLELDRVEQPVEQVADVRAAVAGEGGTASRRRRCVLPRPVQLDGVGAVRARRPRSSSPASSRRSRCAAGSWCRCRATPVDGMPDCRKTGLPSTVTLVAVGRHHAVAVRVDEVLVVPGLLAGVMPAWFSSRTAMTVSWTLPSIV